MKILTVGNLGYVGIPLIKLLKKENFHITGLDTNWFYFNDYSYYNYKNFPNVQIYQDNRNFKLSDLDFVPDIIIYLAAVSNDPMGKKFKFATKNINYEACVKLAQQAKKMQVKKFIFASSCSLYGAADNTVPRKETDRLNPLTDYAKSKVKSEKKLKELSSEKFKVICLRFATAAGYSDNLRLDLVFNDFVANSVCKGKIELLSSGKSWRPLIHVRDMAKAMLWASKFKTKKNFLVLNVGSNKWNFKIIDLATKIGEVIGNKVKIKVKNKNFIDKRSYKVDFSLYNKLSGKYKPSVNFKKAVIELKSFCENNKKKLKNFRKSERWARQVNLDYLIDNRKLDNKLMWRKND